MIPPGILLAGVVVLIAAFIVAWVMVTRPRGQHEAPRGDVLDPLPPRDRFSPGVWLPRTPAPVEVTPPAPVLANPVANPVPSPNGHDGYQALVAAYDRRMTSLTDQLDRRLDTRPDWLRELAPHPDNARAVDSMAQRALTPDLLALLDEENGHG